MSTVEETLAWEAQWRPRATAAALAGSVFGLAGGIMLTFLWASGPDQGEGFISLPETLGTAAAGREPAEPSHLVRLADHRGDKLGLFTLSTVLSVVGALCALFALTYLFRAARSRDPSIGRLVGWSVAAALAIYPIGRAAREIGTWIDYSQFADAAERTAQGQRDIGTEGFIPAATLLELLGLFALALAFVLVALNAMRVGLLTRFLGILGVVVGGLAIFQIDAPQLVRGIWLLLVGLLIAQRYPGGTPPAWQTGRAEPWPSQQQLRERRDAMRAEHTDDAPAGPGGNGAGAGEDEGELLRPGDEGYVPGAARRKRKKRR